MSSKTLVKICGLSREEDIDAVNELLPDYIGFVFWPKSKRYVDSTKAKELKDKLDKRIKAVGVFLDEDIDNVAEFVHKGIIDIVQLHGAEDEEYIRKLKEKTGCEIIKAFNVNKLATLKDADSSSADHIMLDSGAGTGIPFDWSRLNEVKRPYFLAGGLSPDNINEVLSKIQPFAVDVSSGVETDRYKDKNKIISFMKVCRNEN